MIESRTRWKKNQADWVPIEKVMH